MNRVLRQAQAKTVPQFFGGAEPRFVGEDAALLIEAARTEAFEEGRRAGHAETRAEKTAAVERLEAALGTAQTVVRRSFEDQLGKGLEIGLVIAEYALGKAVLDPDTLVTRIRDALGELDDGDLEVDVSASDLHAVADALDTPRGITVSGDPALQPGEARIKGRWSTVDLTREAALDLAREVLT